MTSNDSVYPEYKNFSNLASNNNEIVGDRDLNLQRREREVNISKTNDKHSLSPSNILIEKISAADISELARSTHKIPLLDDAGKCIGVLGVSTDAAELQKMEEQLRISKQMAEAINQAKSDFITNMSHDVKTPLSGIIGMAELLTQRLNQPECVAYVRNIQLAGQKLMAFFDNCLEIAKSQETEVTLVQERFSLKLLIDEVMQLFLPSMEHKGLLFKAQVDGHMPDYVVGSRVGIYRILLNLIGNAVKFTESGFVLVHFKLGENSTAEKVIMKIVVEDSGIGIPLDKQKIIFEQLSRLTPSYKKIYEGGGIGLYFVKKFVNSMGGEIYVHSEGEGRGSKFVVALPLKISLLKEQEYELDFLRPVAPNIKKEPKVLLVEDDHLSQVIATEYLKNAGYSVDLADCGEKAIELFSPGKYNFIFMDIGLPGISGYEAARLIRAKEQGSEQPSGVRILALTAHASSDIQKECDRFYINEVINKPLSLEKIQHYTKK